MPRLLLIAVVAGACLAMPGTSSSQTSAGTNPPQNWRSVLTERMAAFGHRNWVIIADAAYPAQTRGGIETVVTGADHLTVLKAVLDEVSKAKHVRPVVYLDAELRYVSEDDAAGITRMRNDLQELLSERKPKVLPHEEIIEKLDKAGETFRVLVLKTNLTVPYTSVFLELDCGYWSPQAERRLRERMKARK
ncbi:MAG: RbsD/FucU domain-containing protein [Gemmataceae bacterium]